MSRPIVVITGAHRPHELLLLGASVYWGVSYLLGAPPAGSLEAFMPRWAVLTWSAVLLASGVVGLVGCWWRSNMERGLGLELAGMLIADGALLMYITVALLTSRRLTSGIVLIMAWFTANLVRAVQIRRDLKAGSA